MIDQLEKSEADIVLGLFPADHPEKVDMVNLAFGGGDLENWEGSQIVANIIEEHFKPMENEQGKPLVWFAHDYIAFEFSEKGKQDVRKIKIWHSQRRVK